jgi:hypothetical protein
MIRIQATFMGLVLAQTTHSVEVYSRPALAISSTSGVPRPRYRFVAKRVRALGGSFEALIVLVCCGRRRFRAPATRRLLLICIANGKRYLVIAYGGGRNGAKSGARTSCFRCPTPQERTG